MAILRHRPETCKPEMIATIAARAEPASTAGMRSRRARTAREARSLSAIDHPAPNRVPIHGAVPARFPASADRPLRSRRCRRGGRRAGLPRAKRRALALKAAWQGSLSAGAIR